MTDAERDRAVLAKYVLALEDYIYLLKNATDKEGRVALSLAREPSIGISGSCLGEWAREGE